jgi:outer membrane lipoprotein SlyB
MFFIYENPKSRFQRVANIVYQCLFALAMVIAVVAIYDKSQRDEKTVRSIDAGTFVSATAGSGAVSGFVYNGIGGVTSDVLMTITTTEGVYVIEGQHSFNKGESVRIEVARDGHQKLCTSSFCSPIQK